VSSQQDTDASPTCERSAWLTERGRSINLHLRCHGWQIGTAQGYRQSNHAGDLWSIKSNNPQNTAYLTQMPVESAARGQKYSSHRARITLDLFGRNGIALIVAQQACRYACLMELDSLYCDVIVERRHKSARLDAERRSCVDGTTEI
jgi:hypothetical protein